MFCCFITSVMVSDPAICSSWPMTLTAVSTASATDTRNHVSSTLTVRFGTVARGGTWRALQKYSPWDAAAACVVEGIPYPAPHGLLRLFRRIMANIWTLRPRRACKQDPTAVPQKHSSRLGWVALRIQLAVVHDVVTKQFVLWWEDRSNDARCH